MKHFILLLLSVIIYHVALCQLNGDNDWKVVTVNSDPNDFYILSIYKDATKRENGTIKVWVKYDYTTMEYKGKKFEAGNKRELVIVNCLEKELTTICLAFYNGMDEKIGDRCIEEKDAKWSQSFPKSLGELIIKKACELYN